MKAVFTVGLASAATIHHQSSGIDKEDLMQNQDSHFRKQWPQGIIDNSHGDAEIIDMFNEPLPRKKAPKPVVHYTYPFTLDEDVTKTSKSIQQAEGLTKKKLSMDGVKNGGMDMISFYDNNRRVFERDTPWGNTWWKPHTPVKLD